MNFTHKRSNTALPSSNYSQVSCTSSINLDAPILKIQKKGKKMSNHRPWIQMYNKIQCIIYSKPQVSIKIKISKYRMLSLSLSLSRGLCLSQKLERDTSNLSNFSKDIFERNSEVVVSPNLKISNFPGSTSIFKTSQFRIMSKFSTQENLDFQQLLQFQKKEFQN